jgi:tRNA(fMet)-specific endonuclease VapC
MSGTTNRSFLLDTNAVIARIAEDAAIIKMLGETPTLFLASIVLGELYAGAEKSTRVEANLATINKLAASVPILTCDLETARWYGRISHKQRVKGRPIPQNDLWIAAIALQHGLTLLTRDEHFNQVDELSVETW